MQEKKCQDCFFCNLTAFHTGKWYCKNPNIRVGEAISPSKPCFKHREQALAEQKSTKRKRGYMLCPECGNSQIRVYDSRATSVCIIRHRECQNCGLRWKTQETFLSKLPKRTRGDSYGR